MNVPVSTLVAQALQILDAPCEPYQLDGSQKWFLQKGKAKITLELKPSGDSSDSIISIFCPLIKLEEILKPEIILQELLHLNLQYVGISFGLRNGVIFLKTDRETEGLDRDEIYLMLHRVGNLADHFETYLEERSFIA